MEQGTRVCTPARARNSVDDALSGKAPVRPDEERGAIVTLNKGFRRASTLVLLVLGGFFLWLAPETATGVTLLLIGVILEVIGIAVERR